MESKVYNQEGKEVGKVTLPGIVFGAKWNADLVHQVTVSMQANARVHYAHVKMRGQVAGGGKKPWQQKGTGRARHGSIRSPIWVGGGVTHGPNPDKVYARKINQKMRANALYAVLSQKYRDGEILFVDSLSVGSGKTKDAKEALRGLAGVKGYEKILTKPKNAALVVFPKKDEKTVRGLRNFSNLRLDEVRNLNAVNVLGHKYLIVSEPGSAFKILSGRKNKKG